MSAQHDLTKSEESQDDNGNMSSEKLNSANTSKTSDVFLFFLLFQFIKII